MKITTLMLVASMGMTAQVKTVLTDEYKNEVRELRQGSCALIPAAIADYDVVPLQDATRLLDAFINNVDNSFKGKVTRFMHIINKE